MKWLFDNTKNPLIIAGETYNYVKINVHIKNTLTNIIRIYNTEMHLSKNEEFPDTFIWEDGNFACDCNRHSFFECAAGIEPNESIICSDYIYQVNIENPATHEIFYREFD